MNILLKHRLYVVISLIAVTVLTSLGLLNFTLSHVRNKNTYLFEQIIPTYILIGEIQEKLNLRRRHELLYINNVYKERNLGKAQDIKVKLIEDLKQYRKLDSRKATVVSLDKIASLISQYDNELLKLSTHLTDEGYKANLATFDAIFEAFNTLEKANDGYLNDYREEFESFSKNTQKKSIIIYITILLVIVALISVIIRSIITRINFMNITVDGFIDLDIREGNLCRFVDSNKFVHDELGILMLKLKEFRIKISKVIYIAKQNCAHTEESIHSFNQLVTSNADLMQNAQGNMQQLVTALDEISSTATEVSNNISYSSDLTDKSLSKAEETNDVVKNTANSILKTNENLETCNSLVTELEEDSGKISAVLDMISNIAEQTNLLALNAAIEAARAGEQGRGFAVVADEVRMLAKKTQESTETIESIITTLQKRTHQVKNEVTGCYDLMAHCVDNSNEAIGGITDVNTNITSLSEMEAQIATAAQQQTSVTNEINNSAVSINEITKDSFELSLKLKEDLSNIGNETQELKVILDGFEVDEACSTI